MRRNNVIQRKCKKCKSKKVKVFNRFNILVAGVFLQGGFKSCPIPLKRFATKVLPLNGRKAMFKVDFCIILVETSNVETKWKKKDKNSHSNF